VEPSPLVLELLLLAARLLDVEGEVLCLDCLGWKRFTVPRCGPRLEEPSESAELPLLLLLLLVLLPYPEFEASDPEASVDELVPVKELLAPAIALLEGSPETDVVDGEDPDEDPEPEEPPPDEEDDLEPPPLWPPLPPRVEPSRPRPLRLPTICGAMIAANLSAEIVPVTRMVRSRSPTVTTVVGVAAVFTAPLSAASGRVFQ